MNPVPTCPHTNDSYCVMKARQYSLFILVFILTHFSLKHAVLGTPPGLNFLGTEMQRQYQDLCTHCGKKKLGITNISLGISNFKVNTPHTHAFSFSNLSLIDRPFIKNNIHVHVSNEHLFLHQIVLLIFSARRKRSRYST